MPHTNRKRTSMICEFHFWWENRLLTCRRFVVSSQLLSLLQVQISWNYHNNFENKRHRCVSRRYNKTDCNRFLFQPATLSSSSWRFGRCPFMDDTEVHLPFSINNVSESCLLFTLLYGVWFFALFTVGDIFLRKIRGNLVIGSSTNSSNLGLFKIIFGYLWENEIYQVWMRLMKNPKP